MKKSEIHLLIKHYFLRGKPLSETKAKLDKYYSDSVPSYGMVLYRILLWSYEYRNHTKSRSSNVITTPEMINKINDIVLNDPNVKVREIAEIVSISTESLVNILHTHLCMKKLYARCVPRFLTIDQNAFVWPLQSKIWPILTPYLFASICDKG